MKIDIGPQYPHDDPFKAAARLHQSKYRARVLRVDYSEYGNRLTEADGRALLNYYDALGVKEALRKRYPRYSKKRDADLLRSEHIPFNFISPLISQPGLARIVIGDAFGLSLFEPFTIRIEWAPQPAEEFLGDRTSFDTYIQGTDARGEQVGIGIEIKYTERAYKIGRSESGRLRDPDSTYWVTTRDSGCFVGGGSNELAKDDIRQIWRNHLLGLSMVKMKKIDHFVSITLYPSGNEHFARALAKYQDQLIESVHGTVRGCTYENYIDCLSGDRTIEAWKQYLKSRYIVRISA